MIFLFFGTSVALKEAELAPFKDLEEIGNIWDFWKFLLTRPIGKSLNGANSASRRATEVKDWKSVQRCATESWKFKKNANYAKWPDWTDRPDRPDRPDWPDRPDRPDKRIREGWCENWQTCKIANLQFQSVSQWVSQWRSVQEMLAHLKRKIIRI